MVMMGRDQHELDDEHPALLRVVRHSCAGKLAWRQSQCVQQSITDASQVLIFVGGPDKGNLENINGFLRFRLCHDVDHSVRVAAMCPHSN